MVKNLFLLHLTLIFFLKISAQECDNQRYYDEIFSVDVNSNIKFGEAPQPRPLNPNNIQELYLDVYQPNGDTLAARPLIIWAFGGAFVAGSRTSPDIVTLSKAFAKRGYVCAAIDYRLSKDIFIDNDPANLYEAVIKGYHDMAAGVRFFYKDASTINTYKIDTTRICVGGVSAGAVAALHMVHLDEQNEIPADIDSFFQANGAFTGNSGNPGYSQDVAGLISLCGAIGDTAWLDPLDVPIVSMHGTEDGVVPYGSDSITILGVNFPVDGSSSIHPKLDELGTHHALYTWYGAGHTPFVLNPPNEAELYMDTTISFVRDFLYDLVCDGVTSTTETIDNDNLSFVVFPNPNSGNFLVRLDSDENLSITVFDNLGRKVFFNPEIHQGINRLEIDLPKGIYEVKASSKDELKILSRKIIVH